MKRGFSCVQSQVPPTRRSPLAEGRTGLPNPSVAIEHHWFLLSYYISFSGYFCVPCDRLSSWLCVRSSSHIIRLIFFAPHSALCLAYLFVSTIPLIKSISVCTSFVSCYWLFSFSCISIVHSTMLLHLLAYCIVIVIVKTLRYYALTIIASFFERFA